MSAFDSKLQKVAVLMGGASAEREVSLMSGAGVLQALQSLGVNAHAFDPSQRNLCDLKTEGFTCCFIALHGRFGEDGTVQGALELLGIPYTGPGVMASSIAIDKLMTKYIWRAEGLPTEVFVRPGQDGASASVQSRLLQPVVTFHLEPGEGVLDESLRPTVGGEDVAKSGQRGCHACCIRRVGRAHDCQAGA